MPYSLRKYLTNGALSFKIFLLFYNKCEKLLLELIQMIKIGLFGYGNIAKGVECAVTGNSDMQVTSVFTRRDPSTVKVMTEGATVYHTDDVLNHKDDIDVLIMCGGSATDLPEQTPKMAEYFNVVDSFDTHKRIPEHFANVDEKAKKGNKVAIISVGWDPGMFSLLRLYGGAILPEGADYTFWGKGVSQGHSDAIRRIDGVVDARQYTIPVESALEAVRSGSQPELTAREKHTRECFVVVEEGADKERIEREIVTMKNYFDEYDTTVNFISMEELQKNHSGIPHGGFVIRTGKTGKNKENNHVIEYSLKLDSNPEFTSSVIVAFARAAYRLNNEGDSGCKTVFDIAPKYLSVKSNEELRASIL
jgi:diaminopimelate dehydrogenase